MGFGQEHGIDRRIGDRFILFMRDFELDLSGAHLLRDLALGMGVGRLQGKLHGRYGGALGDLRFEMTRGGSGRRGSALRRIDPTVGIRRTDQKMRRCRAHAAMGFMVEFKDIRATVRDIDACRGGRLLGQVTCFAVAQHPAIRFFCFQGIVLARVGRATNISTPPGIIIGDAEGEAFRGDRHERVNKEAACLIIPDIAQLVGHRLVREIDLANVIEE